MLRSRPTGISLTDREIYSRLGHIMIEQAILSELENLDVSDSTSYELESEASAPSSTPSQSRGFVYGIDSSEKVKSCYNKAPSPGPPLESQPNVTTSHSIQAIKPGEGNEILQISRHVVLIYTKPHHSLGAQASPQPHRPPTGCIRWTQISP